MTQEADGSWPQNCWLDGSPYWRGLQLDECAFPMLLLDAAWRSGALRLPDLRPYWSMVQQGRRLRHAERAEDQAGPLGGELPATRPSRIAVAVASLLAAAEIAEALEIDAAPALFRDTADAWNEQIEDWVYVRDTPLAREAGVAGYYIRIAPESPGMGPDPHGRVQVRNHEAGTGSIAADALVSADALALVRFGLRAPDDPRVLDTVKVIDKVLKVDLPQGPGWRRYNLDGYGEKEDGRPFDGVGIGRVWPLLAGERAHYALAAGRRAEAEALLATIEAADQSGRAHSGAGMGRTADPRAGARARPAVRLGDAARLGACGIRQAVAVALGRRGVRHAAAHGPPLYPRQAARPLPAMARGFPDRRASRRDARCASTSCKRRSSAIRATTGARQAEVETSDAGVGLFPAEIATDGMSAGERIVFTWRDKATGAWRGQNFEVAIGA